MLDAVCERFGVPLHRSPVGEAHVVAEMKRRKAVAGGEGNGGMILPAAHYGRDSLVAVVLVAQLLAERGGTLRALAEELPRYSMLKEKLEKPDTPWERSAARLQETFTDYAVETADGLRFSHGDEWVHVRASGTEPVVRVIAESPAEPRTRNLIERARQALRAAA
jgi:phosphomannomutase